MKYGVAIVDICTGMLACNSILAALQARHATGRGQHVEVSLFDSSLAMLAMWPRITSYPDVTRDASVMAIRTSFRIPPTQCRTG